MISISRPINGLSINGDEYLLDEENNIILFKNKKDAKMFLFEKGVTDFEAFNFNKE